jgi:disease resistance protein RPS2
MVLSDDQFQAYVEENNVGKKKCKFCGHLFAFRTSISRIKWHWSGTKGHGAAICREVPKDVQEAAFLAMEGVNKKCRIRADWFINVDNKTERLVKPVAEASSSGGHIPNKSDARENALPTSSSELAGKAFEENKNAILSWLMNDEVLRIGIYGMGGVGKTSLVKHVYNQLRKTSGTFHHVYWITIPQDFSIYKLQNLIARCLGIHLSNEDDEILRAQELSEAFVMKWQPFLILDNLWDTFDPEKVGIHVQEKGCKLILTTRSLKVCRGMGCLQKIKVEPLPWEEAWTLFREKFTHDVVISPEVEQIAKSVTRKCAGLPLGIITMAESMRGVSDLHEWRNTLEKLKKSKVRDMKDKVFPSLRFSYDQLDDLAQQQCFLYCAVFPEDYGISREDLIGYLIDEGIIEGIDSRQAEFDEGHTMLNELENVCLLESCDDYNGYRAVRMHGLIRDMACQILRMSSPIMVGEELRDVDKWKEVLTRVSWINGKFKEIPSGHSPRCPNLSTLLLPYNYTLRFIAYSFFKHLNKLKVLDLSETNIELLPDSFSDLENLSALLLKGCEQLRHVPSLKKLRLLKRLDLSDTALVDVPQDMECLSNLRYLKLNGCSQKEFPPGILPQLYRLQVFALDDWVQGQYAPVTVEGKEVACLRKLETLECHFKCFSDFIGYLKSWDGTLSLSTYKFLVGQWNDNKDYLRVLEFSGRSRKVCLCNFNINWNRSSPFFPCDIQELVILRCTDAGSLCDVLSLQCAIELECIEIQLCDRMESLLSSSWFCSTPLPLPSDGIFSHLKDFHCYGCSSMKKLFPLALLRNLANLELISVEECHKMEEIIATSVDWVVGEESSSSCSSSEFDLPNLRRLNFVYLPKLKSICSAKLICGSLQKIRVRDCPKLKRIPICLPVLDSGQPCPPPSLEEIDVDPKEWWESVEWDHPNTKDVLLPFLVLGDGSRVSDCLKKMKTKEET